ncbi:MAG: PAS domain S-box protein [Anaeromyxobacter sp.]|nr:PAS domain S-box protein [Anaeromyxobacter sp.]MBL0277091.1 PAS domain S-box protein [Anaeromyxobacter sp.]
MSRRPSRAPWRRTLPGALAGAALVAGLATLQRALLGFPAGLISSPRGYLIPALVGGLAGGALAWAWHRLREAEDRYRTVADLATEMIFWRDEAEVVRYASPSCLALTGYTPEELTGTPGLLARLVHPEDADLYRDHRHGVDASGLVQGLEFRIVRKDGAVRWVRHLCRPVLDGAGAQVGVRGSHSDITAEKALQAQLLQVQRLETVGQVAGGVAHDLRNVLTGVIGPATLIQERSQDPEARAAADEILEAARRASGLARDLLDLARREPLRLEPTPLRALVRGSERLLHRVVGDRIMVVFEDDGAPLPVAGDARRLEQVLLNLVTNARDAMPEGGLITVSLRAVPGPVPSALLAVRDQGSGMDPATCGRIFEPFFSTKEAGKGTGLGLSVVDRIVREHHGRISVASAPGRGTTFEVLLPLLPAARAAAAAPAPVA